MGNRFAHDAHLVGLRRNLDDVQSLMERGILVEPDTGRTYFTGYSYETLYDWDQYFEAIVQIYMGWPTEYIRNGVTIFLEHQRESGLISRSVPSNEHHDPEHVKPFLAQMALLVEKATGERDWIVAEPYFSRLKRYLDYWLIEMDGDGNGLSEWMSAPHTGMDNQHERAGFWLDRFCEGVDLNCYLVRECRAFATVASWAGKDALAAEYIAKAEARAERIRALCWDEADGFFYDRNARAGEYSDEPPCRLGLGDEPRRGRADSGQDGGGVRRAVGRRGDAGTGAAHGFRASVQRGRVLVGVPRAGDGAQRAVVLPRLSPGRPGLRLAGQNLGTHEHHDLLGAAALRPPGTRLAGCSRHPAPRAGGRQ